MKLLLILFIIIKLDTILMKVQVERNIIAKVVNESGGVESLSRVAQWRSFLKNQIFSSLKRLPGSMKTELIRRADQEKTSGWTSYRVSQYLEYSRRGNRQNYEQTDITRRSKMTKLLIGHLLVDNDNYLDQILDGLWLMCEESTWTMPAHIVSQKSGKSLPDPADEFIGIRASETAVFLAYVRLLLGDSLANVSSVFIQRIDLELNKRIVKPYLNTDMWWMQSTNNWNSWLNANILQTVLLAIDDQKVRSRLISKSIGSIDRHLNSYADDGGCEEGPTYWDVAGGKLVEFIWLLNQVSEGRMQFKNQKLIRNIGDYIYKIHINEKFFINYGDAHVLFTPSTSRILKFFELFQNDKMKNFARYIHSLESRRYLITSTDSSGYFGEFINILLAHDKLKSIENLDVSNEIGDFEESSVTWLKDTELVAFRSNSDQLSAGVSPQLFFACKGGSNGESHNHNDVGNFVVYADGRPAIIDIGVGTYDWRTFGPNRYDIWYLQSQWHNCPTINGMMQNAGDGFKATSVRFDVEKRLFSLNIADAYPGAAAVRKWTRTFDFDPNNNRLDIVEDYQLKSWIKPFQLHLITNLTASATRNQSVILRDQHSNQPILSVDFAGQQLDASIEKKLIGDQRLIKMWTTEHLTRINLTQTNRNKLKGQVKVQIKLLVKSGRNQVRKYKNKLFG